MPRSATTLAALFAAAIISLLANPAPAAEDGVIRIGMTLRMIVENGIKYGQLTSAELNSINDSGGINGHITALGHEPQHFVTVYVQVDNVQAYLTKAETLGGKTLVPPVEIPTGTFAWFADPDGNIIGLWKPKP